MSTREYQKKADKFRELYDNKPQPGDVLYAINFRSDVVVDRRHKDVAMYTTAIINADADGWGLELASYGLKVMIEPRDHQKLIENSGGRKLFVTALRITRVSKSGTALIGEVVE